MSFGAELHGVTKSFASVHANHGVNLHIEPKTIHALVGENGAGKSTAIKILSGLIQPDQGTIKYDNQIVTDWNPTKALKKGIGVVHQHFMLGEPETVHDNLVLGFESHLLGFRNRTQERSKLEQLMQSTNLEVPLDAPIETLPIGLQSRCEILKVLYRKAEFLILDEPTAVLTPQEVESLLKTLKILRDQGKTILIVTHKLKEVFAVAESATVLRAGKTVATRKISETSIEELSELMVGRHVHMPQVKAVQNFNHHTLKLTIESQLELRSGIITGIAGVEGNGQEQLIKLILEKTVSEPTALIPADRHKEGLVLSFNLYENLRLKRDLNQSISRFKYFANPTPKEKHLIQAFDIRPANLHLKAKNLSGGNQQKLIAARELGDLKPQSIVLAVHPTRGVDIGAIEFIRNQLLLAAKNEAAILLISSELDELMTLSHKIGVIFKGKITQWFTGPPYDESKLGLAMLRGHS